MSAVKETKFFSDSDYYSRGIEWYQQFYKNYEGEEEVGEADTGIMYYPGSAERVYKVNPDMHLLFIVRNPVEQVFSHYWFGVERGLYDCSTRTFSEFIRDRDNRWTQRTLDVAKYYEQISRFDDFFGAGQKKVMLFRDLTDRTKQVLREAYSFIGVDRSYTPTELKSKNVTTYPSAPTIYRQISRIWRPIRSMLPSAVIENSATLRGAVKQFLFSSRKGKPSMKEEDRRYLQEYYQEHNDRLESYLGRDLSHWT